MDALYFRHQIYLPSLIASSEVESRRRGLTLMRLKIGMNYREVATLTPDAGDHRGSPLLCGAWLAGAWSRPTRSRWGRVGSVSTCSTCSTEIRDRFHLDAHTRLHNSSACTQRQLWRLFNSRDGTQKRHDARRRAGPTSFSKLRVCSWPRRQAMLRARRRRQQQHLRETRASRPKGLVHLHQQAGVTGTWQGHKQKRKQKRKQKKQKQKRKFFTPHLPTRRIIKHEASSSDHLGRHEVNRCIEKRIEPPSGIAERRPPPLPFPEAGYSFAGPRRLQQEFSAEHVVRSSRPAIGDMFPQTSCVRGAGVSKHAVRPGRSADPADRLSASSMVRSKERTTRGGYRSSLTSDDPINGVDERRAGMF